MAGEQSGRGCYLSQMLFSVLLHHWLHLPHDRCQSHPCLVFPLHPHKSALAEEYHVSLSYKERNMTDNYLHTSMCTHTSTNIHNTHTHTHVHTYSVTTDKGTLNTPELAMAARGSKAAVELVKYCNTSCRVPWGYSFSVGLTLRPFFSSATGNCLVVDKKTIWIIRNA